MADPEIADGFENDNGTPSSPAVEPDGKQPTAKSFDMDFDVDDGRGNDNSDDDDLGDAVADPTMLFALYRDKGRDLDHLMENGTNMYGKDSHGWTCLHWASMRGHDHILDQISSMLKNSGKKWKALLDAKDDMTGWTALHVAVVGEHVSCVQALLDLGINPDVTNIFGETAADCINFNSDKRINGKKCCKLLAYLLVKSEEPDDPNIQQDNYEEQKEEEKADERKESEPVVRPAPVSKADIVEEQKEEEGNDDAYEQDFE